MKVSILQKIVGFTESKYMRIMTNGFMSIAAISIAGSLFSLVKSIPIGPWQTFLEASGLGEMLSIPISITSSLMGVYVVLAMAYTLGKEFKKDAFGCAIISLGAFMMLTPFNATTYTMSEAGERVAQYTENVLPLSSLGAQGIFLAIIVGLLASRLYVFFLDRGWKIKMPDTVPPSVSKMFEMMIPGCLVFLIFLVIRGLFEMSSFDTAQNFIYTLLQTPLMSVGGGLVGCMVYLTVGKILWCFGIHGDMVAYASMATIQGAALSANLSAFAVGTACPFPEWAYSSVLMDCSLLGLSIVMLFTAKAEQFKILSKISLPTSLFNITEPLIFGIPMIMNPIMSIPFILLQPINLILTVVVVKFGIIVGPTGATTSTVLPAFLQFGFLSSHWSGFVWGIVLLILDILVWYPFFKIIDKKAYEDEQLKELSAEVV
ncbi:hypothetical protein A5865_001249 [Enterococcus sp. 12E11_DIV0728]|nr:hypothetical protein A5865_001249 [Enterococcus sp. 12E11_DIV0728]OUZ16452.1 hypothetical protein A5868_001373 [Enterococcus sp. 12F9_DIV0723]